MRDFLSAIRADLLDRRMRLPALAAVVLLVAAVAYAALGGHSEPVSVAGGQPGGAGAAGTPSLGQGTASANPAKAQAETTYGGAYQHAGGPLVDPFKAPAPTATGPTGKSASSSKAGSAGSSKPGAGGSSGGSSPSSSSGAHGGSGGGSSTSASKPKPRTVYVVDVEFGKAPAAVGEAPHLVAFKGIKVGGAVPSRRDHLMTLKSATLDSKTMEKGQGKESATFALSSSQPPIVSGQGRCLPSPTQCESLRLALGQTAELQYLEADGQTATYLLKLSGVSKHTLT